ncbi:MAG: hypothetical protein GXY33_10120 [Phycisphaerae bacterium]|nr:hypothetical protein [Phycisphaerae bacterium]
MFQEFFLEGFGWMLASFVLLLVIALATYYFQQSPWSKKFLAYAPPIMLVLLAVNYFVVTDREDIRNKVKIGVQACRDGNADALRPIIASSFSTEGLDRDALIAIAREVFQHVKLQSVWVTDVQIDVPEARLAALSELATTGGPQGAVKSDWQLIFTEEADGWKISSVKPISINNVPYEKLLEVVGEAKHF